MSSAPKLGIEELVNLAISQRSEEERLAFTLEICDWVNQQKRDGPLKASDALLAKVNSRNEKIALPALDILDACVKNCSFPFHLQVSSKRFLNELVRTFPEKPMTPVNAIHTKILELLQVWRLAFEKSRYKDDLRLTTEMCKLLKSKGYKFPKAKADPNLVVNDASLLTEEELQKEDQKAQAAKLDELLRRGTPQDLAQANELMKAMAGYDFNAKPDYKQEVSNQLKKLESNCKDALDILNTFKPGDDPTLHLKLQELLGTIRSAQGKIKKSIEEDPDEQLELFLHVNDLINSVFESYESIKSIHQNKAAAPAEAPRASNASNYSKQGTLRNSTLPPATASINSNDNERKQEPPKEQTTGAISLINLDLDFGAPSVTSNFANFSISPPPTGTPQFQQPQSNSGTWKGSIFQQASQQPQQSFGQDLFQPAFPTSQPAFPANQLNQTQPIQLNQSIQSFTNFQAFQQPTQPIQPIQPVNQPPVSFQQPTQPISISNPFQSSNSQPIQSPPRSPPMPSMQPLQPLQPIQPTPVAQSPPSYQASSMMTQSIQQQAPQKQSTASSLITPHIEMGTSAVSILNKNGVEILAQFEKVNGSAGNLVFHTKIVNNLTTPMTDFVIQLAVPKSMKLKLDPLSANTIAPSKMGGQPVTQKIHLENPSNTPIRIRYKLNYKMSGQLFEDQGEFTNIPLFN